MHLQEITPSMETGDLCADTAPTPKSKACQDPGAVNDTCGFTTYLDTPYSNYMSYTGKMDQSNGAFCSRVVVEQNKWPIKQTGYTTLLLHVLSHLFTVDISNAFSDLQTCCIVKQQLRPLFEPDVQRLTGALPQFRLIRWQLHQPLHSESSCQDALLCWPDLPEVADAPSTCPYPSRPHSDWPEHRFCLDILAPTSERSTLSKVWLLGSLIWLICCMCCFL